MISLHFNINNPWAEENFKNLFNYSGLFTKHKAWEIEAYRHSYDIFGISTILTFRQDHAGFKLILSLFGYSMQFSIYDTRHWDEEGRCWENYGD